MKILKKTRAKTLIERYGFKDEELTTSKHDEILLWLMDKKNFWKMIYENSEELGIKKSRLQAIPPNKIKITVEYPVKNENNYLIGFIDLTAMDVAIEIKPKIRSIGETIRQINFYRNYCKRFSYWIIVTETPNLQEIFASQNIFVFEFQKLKNSKIENYGVGN